MVGWETNRSCRASFAGHLLPSIDISVPISASSCQRPRLSVGANENKEKTRQPFRLPGSCIPSMFALCYAPAGILAPLTVVMIALATMYGSALEAGRRSSSQPFQPFSTVPIGIRIDAPRSETP